MSSIRESLLRQIPAVSELLLHETVRAWLAESPRADVVAALRQACDGLRTEILRGAVQDVNVDALLARADGHRSLAATPSLRAVINATGIVLHTGLGRAALGDDALAAVCDAAGYCNLEFDLETGERGRRSDHVARKLCELTGAEAATVVNNNAAATFLILNTLANGREAVVSRGQLIEIGGSYRLPDVMAKSGAILREVGTTNRTRIADYEAAVGPATALLVHVHTSNYRVAGFTESPGIAEIVAVGRSRRVSVYDDLGSGAIVSLRALGLPNEPDARSSLSAGADVVSFSGDKLLGGPQAGIICGRANVIRRLTLNPLMRTYRPDKLTLAALEATLRAWSDLDSARVRIPTVRMLSEPIDVLDRRAGALCERLRAVRPADAFEVCDAPSYAGGGTLPTIELPSRGVRWRPARESPDAIHSRLRASSPPIVARVHEGAVWFDARTISDVDVDVISNVVGCWG